MSELPPPLPPAERTVGQLVAESLRLYGRRFWPSLALGVPAALLNLLARLLDDTLLLVVVPIVGGLLLSASYLGAVALASERPVRVLRALVGGVLVFLPFPFLTAFFILPGLAWLTAFGLVVPVLALEEIGFGTAFLRAYKLARADFVHALGSLATLAILVFLTQSVLFFLLRGTGDQTSTSRPSSQRSWSRRSSSSARRSFTSTRPHAKICGIYNERSRELQDRYDTRRLADRLSEGTVRDHIRDSDRAFIEARDMFFLATADEQGRPQCSYKGGAPGFVRVLDEHTIAFPNYDGNGMYLSMGNALVNPHVGLLFIDFEERRRMRLNGVASVDLDDPLRAEWPEAQFVVRVRATRGVPELPALHPRVPAREALAVRAERGVRDTGARVEAERVGARRAA